LNGICIGIYNNPSDIVKIDESLKELEALCETLGIKVIETFLLKIKEVNPATLITNTMIEEIKNVVIDKEIDVIVFNDEIRPNQQRNLEKEINVMVIDRTELILRIFEQNARTSEAKTQVEIAKLKYMLPRLKRMWTHLSRIEGGYGFTKGPGEKQIEIDKRIIKKRIAKLSRKLEEIKENREVMREKRIKINFPLVSIIGYTNAGKTSLLNLLSKEKLLSENKLFSTLSPVIRRVYINNQIILFADTVGFIKKLPTQLIASFKSTLEEIKYSKLLLILQDSTSDNIKENLEVVFSILEEIGSLNKKYILVFSKIDKIDKYRIENLLKEYPDALFISSLSGEGIEELKEKVFKEIYG